MACEKGLTGCEELNHYLLKGPCYIFFTGTHGAYYDVLPLALPVL